MELAEALELTRPADRQCPLVRLVTDTDALTEPQRDDVLEALEGTAVTHARLARALSLMLGTRVSDDAIGKHRRGRCGCGA